ncbi:heptaprenyl diphosphate synthase component 1 [Microbacteriaceae bacterium 4G12]
MHDIYEGFTAIREQLVKRLQHPYLMRYIDTPFVDEAKLLVLYSILKRANLHIEQIQHYVLNIMLVQIALDTHEKVSDKAGMEQTGAHKRRQLTVLAGDYYSGLYYYLLSENRDIALVRALAEGIKEINEEKIKLYRKSNDSIEEVVRSIAIIESALLQKACDYFHVSEWKEFAMATLTLKRIEREYVRYRRMEEAPFFSAVEQVVKPSERLEDLYEAYMKKTKECIQQMTIGNQELAKTAKLMHI